MYEETVALISQVGFPIFVAVFMLFRSDKREEQTQRALTDLTIAINNMTEAVKK